MKIKLAFISLALSIPAFASSEKEVLSLNLSKVDIGREILIKSRTENHRNQFLDYYLSSKGIKLPISDFLLIAYQPVGIVSSCIIVDLDARSVRILPGTHEKKNERIIELKESEYEYLEELNSSDQMQNFPSQSGNLGMDGYSIVIYSKSGETKRYISHWGPEYMGLDIFTSLLDRFKNGSNQSE